MGVLKQWLSMVCALMMANSVQAVAPNKEFSAQAIISIPQQAPRISRLFVGKKAVRNEISADNQHLVEIVFPDQGRAVLINDAAKAYRERNFPPQNEDRKTNNPCAQIINARCEKKGTEMINGMKTEKWEIVSTANGQKIRTLHWIDSKRKLALREFFPDGTVAELKMLGKEKLNGRNTEKWQRTLDRPDGSNITSYQWYDTELGIAIREELPGGYVRELKNIKVVVQPGSLFTIPRQYSRLEEPEPDHLNSNYTPAQAQPGIR